MNHPRLPMRTVVAELLQTAMPLAALAAAVVAIVLVPTNLLFGHPVAALGWFIGCLLTILTLSVLSRFQRATP